MLEIFTLLYGAIAGSLFGFFLYKSGVLNPEIIIGQFQFRNWIMLKVFMSAIATSLIIYSIIFHLGFERLSWKITVIHTDIIGGLILGVGIVLAGACPGTVFGQIGAGYKDAIFALIGGLIGSLIYSSLKPYITNLFTPWPNKVMTLDSFFNVPFWKIAVPLCIMIVGILYLIEKFISSTNSSYQE